MRVLAIDHGGLRGIAATRLLIHLEEQLGPLHEYFDLFVGTSAGSIIATGLATGMTASMIHQCFLTNRHRIFKKSQNLLGMVWRSNSSLYETTGLDTVLQEQFSGFQMTPISIRKKLCIISSTLSTQPASTFLFRNYEAPSRYPCMTGIPVWKAVRASSSAPLYFAPFQDPTLVAPFPHTGELVGKRFVDGAVTAKSSSVAVSEARALCSPTEHITIVSICPGTVPSRATLPSPTSSIAKIVSTLSSITNNLSHFRSVLNAVVDSATMTEEMNASLEDCLALANGTTGSFSDNGFDIKNKVNYFRFRPTLSFDFSMDEVRANKITHLMDDVKGFVEEDRCREMVEMLQKVYIRDESREFNFQSINK
ncbi:hypothetical protein P9112_009787 [Eukaryota sp. TZLM1-RC]